MTRLIRKLTVTASSLLLAVGLTTSAGAGTLVINSNTSDPAPKAAFEQLIEKFKAENSDTVVKFNVFDHEGFKTSIRNFLTSSAPDVVTWFAGERMKTFVDRGLLEDVSDVWEANGLKKSMASSLSSMTVDGKQYGVPYTYYQWGVYYRKDIFAQQGIEVPKTWDQFIAAGKKLNENGVTPVAIGTKFLWTTAGWFDYLNLRLNGLDFHLQLMAGKVPYADDRVRKVFTYWRQLIDNKFFIANHASYSWQEAQPFVFQGKAAMYLIGNFFVPFFPPEVADKMGYFQFPVIDESVGLFEDAPTDTLHIPSKAKNKADARKFLAFMARPENQAELNKALGQLPPNKDAAVADDPYLQAGFELLSKAEGLGQFYDRDTNPEMAKTGMKGFQEFMIKHQGSSRTGWTRS